MPLTAHGASVSSAARGPLRPRGQLAGLRSGAHIGLNHLLQKMKVLAAVGFLGQSPAALALGGLRLLRLGGPEDNGKRAG
jgi:hypothetical protein